MVLYLTSILYVCLQLWYYIIIILYVHILQPDVEFRRDKDGQLLLQQSTPLTSEPAAAVVMGGKKGKGKDKPVIPVSISNTKDNNINGK